MYSDNTPDVKFINFKFYKYFCLNLCYEKKNKTK